MILKVVRRNKGGAQDNRPDVDRVFFLSIHQIRGGRRRGIAPTFLDFSPCAHNEKRAAARGIGGSREY